MPLSLIRERRLPSVPLLPQVTEWELLNDNKALWLRNPSEVAEEEHTKFYKALAKVKLTFWVRDLS